MDAAVSPVDTSGAHRGPAKIRSQKPPCGRALVIYPVQTSLIAQGCAYTPRGDAHCPSLVCHSHGQSASPQRQLLVVLGLLLFFTSIIILNVDTEKTSTEFGHFNFIISLVEFSHFSLVNVSTKESAIQMPAWLPSPKCAHMW